MCELLGISASQSVSAQRELGEFRLRGGLSADNPDGWGLAWWERGDFRLAKEPLPAYRSILFKDLADTATSNLIIAHVRKAKFPPVNTLNNTHPFQRDCCGKPWVFAHNGLVPDIVGMEQANAQATCQPSGETDSEYAFCHLLSHLAQNSGGGNAGADTASAFGILAMVSELVAAHGKFNFLMSDGEYLIAYGHDRLHYLERGEGADGHVIIATEPLLGHAGWIPFDAGELRVYRSGRLAGRILTCPPGNAERQGLAPA